jgi:hypothetical protein
MTMNHCASSSQSCMRFVCLFVKFLSATDIVSFQALSKIGTLLSTDVNQLQKVGVLMTIPIVSNHWLARSLPKPSEKRTKLSPSEMMLLLHTGMYATLTNQPIQRLTLTMQFLHNADIVCNALFARQLLNNLSCKRPSNLTLKCH